MIEKEASERVEDRDPVDVLAEQFADRCRRGEYPSIAEYIEKYPEHEEAINEVFPAVAMMEQLRKSESTDRELAKRPTRRATLKIDRIGEYDIVREIGRGGMGIVYEAVQRTLGRRVALKVLSTPSLSSPRHVRRFHREAQAAARLHHTNIVPVFGVGQQDDMHYYVMQFISGVGLDEVLSSLRSIAREEGDRDALSAAASGLSGERSASALVTAKALRAGDFAAPRTIHSTADSYSSASFADSVTGTTLNEPAESSAVETRVLPKPLSGIQTGSENVSQSETHPAAPRPDRLDHLKTKVFHESSPGNSDHTASDTGKAELSDENDVFDVTARFGSLYFKSIARIGLQAAAALQYAHANHVLHRDIKPGNLLLDGQGTIWVADFGLAKLAEQDELTKSGDLIGTLKYMAPEQFNGEADFRSDIYSLGLTIYELLTLRPAFAETSYKRLVEQINSHAIASPRAANPGIPRELETIVLKAISHSPTHRYQTAGELADDLQSFIDERPISARRVTPVEQLWRWSNRNRAVASLGLLALVLLITTAIVSSIGFVRKREAHQQVTNALAGEKEQRAKAETTSALAWGALDELFDRFAPERVSTPNELTIEDDQGEEIAIAVQPVLSEQAALLLESMLPYYDKLAEQGDDDVEHLRRIANANRRVGDIHERLGQFAKAEASYDAALAKYEQLGPDQDVLARIEIASIYNAQAGIKRQTSRSDEATDLLRAARNSLEPLALYRKDAPAVARYELALVYYSAVSRWSSLGRSGRSQRSTRSGGRPSSRSQWSENDVMLDEAIRLLTDLSTSYPSVPSYKHVLSRCYRLRSARLFRRGAADAENNLAMATRHLEALVKTYPQRPDYVHDLVEAYALYDRQWFDDPMNVTSIEERLLQALERAEDLVRQHPNVPDYLTSQVQTHRKLGTLYDESQRWLEAHEHFEQALLLQTDLCDRFPEIGNLQFWRLIIKRSLAQTKGAQNQWPAAVEMLETSIDEYETIYANRRGSGMLYRFLRYSLRDAYRQVGNDAAADEVDRELEASRRESEQQRRGSSRGRPRGSEFN